MRVQPGVRRLAPWPALGSALLGSILALLLPAGRAQAAGLTLDQFKLTFDESFNNFSISARGNTRWIAHTPWYGDFGSAAFADPKPGFPFTVKDNILRIEARKDATGKWQSGLICSRQSDAPGAAGFTQKYGYFEIRAKLPNGPGTWPAFWLIGIDKTMHSSEIDILEQYGAFPDIYHVGLLVHTKGAPPQTKGQPITIPGGKMESQFNDYGVSIDPKHTTFYFNREPVWQTETTDAFKQPMYILADLALGGGWPIKDTPDPSYFYIQHIRVYQFKNLPQ